MIIEERLYSAIDIAQPIVDKDIPAKSQYSFLVWLFSSEFLFFPQKWREGDDGFRTMLLEVQNAIAYLVDQESFDAERNDVEDEGGKLPSNDHAAGMWQFMKKLRLEMALAQFLGKNRSRGTQMKCRTILKHCGVRRRSLFFCIEFEIALNFYHIGLFRPRSGNVTFSLGNCSLDERINLIRL